MSKGEKSMRHKKKNHGPLVIGQQDEFIFAIRTPFTMNKNTKDGKNPQRKLHPGSIG